MRVDVWRIDVRRAPGDLVRLLSDDEAERAARFRFDRDREAFVATRGALRVLTGSYLHVSPEAVTFVHGPKGKPEVPGLSFNVSHARDVALAAFARSGRLGVDVEAMRPEIDARSLALRFFTAAENAALARLPSHAWMRGFYACWTQKEAFVKALGEGLSFELGRVEVAVHPQPACVRAVDGDGHAGSCWTMSEIECGEGYVGAVAVDSPDVDVVVYDWRARRGHEPARSPRRGSASR